MIDLHTHSTVSDGTEPPEEVIAQAARAGLTAVALTDHDAVDGWTAATEAATRHGLALVRGAELSTRHRGISVHLLAYLFDPHQSDLASAMARIRDDRLPRLRTIVERMEDDGIEITWPEVEALATEGAAPGRPHIADALVAKGLVRDRTEAFDTWLHNRSRYYVPHFTIDTSDAIALVRAAGGVPVLAHPFATRRGWTIDGDDVRELADAGLLGIEVNHRDHEDEEVELAGSLARELDLIATGSSDYHGEGKPNRLGENATSEESLAAIEEAATSGLTILR
ncbi:PHP domain-containing protein [Janibacter sp. GXQ6167]|uniref:PHP domain-containing protein n=1 Tax=Janibacter sp. GXQ6167 TaxID=3240791 RepID=UPI003525D134